MGQLPGLVRVKSTPLNNPDVPRAPYSESAVAVLGPRMTRFYVFVVGPCGDVLDTGEVESHSQIEAEQLAEILRGENAAEIWADAKIVKRLEERQAT